MKKVEIIIKDTHRGLRYEDGVLNKVLEEAGRYEIQNREGIFGRTGPVVEVVLVDMRERDLTIKGQEILTSDKVALRVSIIVQFRVMDPKLAIHAVEKYEDRLYSDVQLAARRSLASMTLEDILTNRNRLSEDILSDVKATAASYGVTIQRADVKDLVFPGNLQEIMNKVLAAERMSQVQLVEARTKADVQKIESQAKAEAQRIEAEVRANAQRLESQGDAADVLSLSFLLAICHRMLIKSDIDARISITTELSQCLKLQHSQQRRVFAWACAVRSRSCKRRISASVSRRCTSARKRPFTVSLFPVPDRTISRGLLQREQERLKT